MSPVCLHNFMLATREAGVRMEEYRVNTRGHCSHAPPGRWKTGTTVSWLDIDYVKMPCQTPRAKRRTAARPSSSSPTSRPPSTKLNSLLAESDKLRGLKVPDPRTSPRMGNRLRALELYRQRVHKEKLIEGWIEGPVAEAADLRGINTLMMDFFDDPEFVAELFEFVLELELTFAKAQVASGAELIGVGDAAASLVGPKIYQEFVWPYEKRMMDGLRAIGARRACTFAATRGRFSACWARLDCDFVDLDSLVPMAEGA